MNQQIVSLSGGKDSTALLLMMLERGESVDAAVYFDAGEWEFPQMAKHLVQVEKTIAPIPLVRLHPRIPFIEQLLVTPVIPRTGPNKGKVRFVGRGWPSAMRRWCTRDKAETLDRWIKANAVGATRLVGFAADEKHRAENDGKLRELGPVRFPLIEWGITEADALDYCRQRGFDWGGLYDVFPRVSCFCCPLQRLSELRKLRTYFPEQWATMLEWESAMERPKAHRRFKGESTLHDLDARFAEEDRQLTLPGLDAA